MKTVVVFALALILAQTAAEQTFTCPIFFTAIGNGCYAFPDEGLSWGNANQVCQFMGGYLVRIGSQHEQSDLKSFYDTKLTSSGYINRWIGASDSLSEGIWRWVPSGATLDYTNWQTGLPSVGISHFDCAFWDGVNNVWRDQDCCDTLSNTAALCEADPLPTN